MLAVLFSLKGMTMAKDIVYELVPWDSRKPAFRLTREEFKQYVLHEEEILINCPTGYYDGFASEWGLFPCLENSLDVVYDVDHGSVLYGTEKYQFRARAPLFSGRWWRMKFTN